MQYLRQGDHLVCIANRGGQYCTGGRKGKWTPLSLQPEVTQIVTAHRYYATLKADPTYKKRVTWFTSLPDADGKAMWEYQGKRHSSNAESLKTVGAHST